MLFAYAFLFPEVSFLVFFVIPVKVKWIALFSAGVLVPVSYTHLRAHETVLDLVCRLLLEKKKKQNLDNRHNMVYILQTKRMT